MMFSLFNNRYLGILEGVIGLAIVSGVVAVGAALVAAVVKRSR
jgi:hypothetical protein